MNAKMIISVCLLLSSIAVQAAGALPQGRWEVTQVTIEKNTGGNIQTTVYNTAADVQSYIPCPKEWEINEKNIVLHYLNGVEESVEYTFEGDRLIILEDSMLPYWYSINGENLILTTTTTYIYANNLPTGQTERIEEKWTITLKKQK